jgi:hypothetical protein
VIVPGFNEQIVLSTRANTSSSFSVGNPLPSPVNTSTEGTPFVSSNGLSLYFFSTRSGGKGNRDLYVATRSSTAQAFSSVSNLTTVNSSALDHLPWVSPDELVLYYSSLRSGSVGFDVWTASRASKAAAFSTPVKVASLNSSQDDSGLTLSTNQLEAIVSSTRTGSQGWDLYWASRASTSAPFSVPVPLATLNTSATEADPELTEDGGELYFTSTRNGGAVEIWRSTRSCP